VLLLVCLLFFSMLFYTISLCSKSLHMLQQNLYNENNRYIKWCLSNTDLSLLNINAFGILFSIFLFLTENEYLIIFFLICMMFIYTVSYFLDKRKRKTDQGKKPLVITKRINRLIITLGIIYIMPLLMWFLNSDLHNVAILVFSIVISLNFYIVFMANIINIPVEKIVFQHFERLAKNKLANMPNLKVVGITGSYGKTSSKNILNEILSIKYNSLATPKSLNTFYGLMITINNKLTKFDEVFVAEMGAYVRGEIHGLCELVNPKYGIITSIGTAHLGTFGSEENIQKGKMELIEYLPSDGVGILNRDDPKQVSYKLKNNCKVLWIGINNKDVDVYASNISCDNKGTTFDVKFKSEAKTYRFETKLLGAHNVYNILASLALGYELGINIKDLQTAVRRVKPVEHRLELKKLGNIYQIDDAYNSNPVGAKAALDVLGMMKGTKVVVTPGMVELGEKEDYYNQIFGEQIASVADYAILVGKRKTKPIYDGLINKGFSEERIHILNDVRDAYPLVNKLKSGNKDIYALFENDLPDTYTEK